MQPRNRDAFRHGELPFGTGQQTRPAIRAPFTCATCGESRPYNQRRTKIDAERGRITVCAACAREASSAA